MIAKMKMPVDTIFGNRLHLELEAELDNPHSLTNRTLYRLMAEQMQFMLNEVRHANEKALATTDLLLTPKTLAQMREAEEESDDTEAHVRRG